VASAAPQPAAREKDETEPIRCHLHRKPQLGCKTCRRLHASALGLEQASKDASDAKLNGSGEALNLEDLLNDASNRRVGVEAFEITNKSTFNFGQMLREQVLKSTYFKSLMNVETFDGIVDQLYQYADNVEVYGAGTTTVPSTLFCCLFRLFTIGLAYTELMQLLENRDNPYIRCCGFLYIRFGCAAEKLWEHLGEYCLDDQEFEPSKNTQSFTLTIGEYVEALLMEERYYFTNLPRIPVNVKKRIEEKVAPLAQYRRRTIANSKNLALFQVPNAPVEAHINGEWVEGEALAVDERVPSRIRVRVRLANGSEEHVHIGKVLLSDEQRRRGRSRSRSPRRGHSPDWSRHKGKTDEEMLHDLRARQRERAVCSTGKDYARKPIGFMSGLAMKRDLGTQSTRLREEETYASRQVERSERTSRGKMVEEQDAVQLRAKTEAERENQKFQQALYEKYGVAAQKPATGKKEDTPSAAVEAPEILRLG